MNVSPSSERRHASHSTDENTTLKDVAAAAAATVIDSAPTTACTATSSSATVRQPLAATVYHHVLHSIYRFLTLREFATCAACVCRHWLSAALSLPPAQLTLREYYIPSDDPLLVHTQLLPLFDSRLRHQCSDLSLCSSKSLQSPHLLQIISDKLCYVQRLRVKLAHTATEGWLASTPTPTATDTPAASLPLLSWPRAFHFPSRLRHLKQRSTSFSQRKARLSMCQWLQSASFNYARRSHRLRR